MHFCGEHFYFLAMPGGNQGDHGGPGRPRRPRTLHATTFYLNNGCYLLVWEQRSWAKVLRTWPSSAVPRPKITLRTHSRPSICPNSQPLKIKNSTFSLHRAKKVTFVEQFSHNIVLMDCMCDCSMRLAKLSLIQFTDIPRHKQQLCTMILQGMVANRIHSHP